MNFKKFENPKKTANNEDRAFVEFDSLNTLWFNTGTQCNLSCENCYIESSPTNDSLVYLDKEDISKYLTEIKNEKFKVELIGLTGGEPFLNPNIIEILDACLKEGHEALVLTNAYRVLKRHQSSLLELKIMYKDKLHIRVSLDHYTQAVHEQERGAKTFLNTLESVEWLAEQGFNVSIAGRSLEAESVEQADNGYKALFDEKGIKLDLQLGSNFVIFPEMNLNKEVPEITTECWEILSKSPSDQMCANERMVVKKKGSAECTVLPCTLLAYDEFFEMGNTLKESMSPVYLKHKFCAQFCVLGGASCSTVK